MKKSASLEQSQTRGPRVRGVGKQMASAVPGAGSVKLSPARTGKSTGLLEEHFADDHETHAVCFEYYNPAAKEVSVAGSFNNWQPCATPLTKQRGGKWSTEILLHPGHYEYRLVVDGQWQDDPMAARFVANAYGGLNCVVEVKSMASPAASQP